MSNSALPKRLQNPDTWKGTDDDNLWMRWRIPLKGLFAYGPRATEWWAKWREFPITLFAIRSKQGTFRVESEGWERDTAIEDRCDETLLMNDGWFVVRVNVHPDIELYQRGYLSRVQYYTRWSFQIQWPFMIAFHWYWKAADVPVYGQPRPDTDGKLIFGYFGAHRDADKVYWFPSAFLGRVWK